MMMAAIILIALATALPSIRQEAQREKEEELIFRGMQYARGVALFRAKFNRFPANVKEMVQTNGMRFLRQEYKDPMTPKGKWRFIHANAQGVVLDSKTLARPGGPGQNSQNTPLGGTAGSGQTTDSGDSLAQAGNSSALGGTSSFGSSQSSSFGSSQSSSFGSSRGTGFSSSSSFNSSSSQQSSAFFGEGNEIQGAFIVGVASTNRRESIRIWNKHKKYDEWEFIGVDLAALGMAPGGIPGQQGQTGAQGQQGPFGQQGQTGQFGQPGQPMRPGSFGSNSFSGPSTTQPDNPPAQPPTPPSDSQTPPPDQP